MQRLLVFPFILLLAAPAGAETTTITVTKADCRNVVAHTPDASVAYTPGVTANGRRVAPADLGGGSTIKPPESFSIQIDVDLEEYFGLPANKGRFMGDLNAGKVEFKDGKLTYNGQELATGSQNAVAEACRKLQQQ